MVVSTSSILVVFLTWSGRGVMDGVIGDGAGGRGESSERVVGDPRGARLLFLFRDLIMLTMAVKSSF